MHELAFRFTVAELGTFIPLGTLLGAVVGALGSYFGSSKAADKASAAHLEAARQAATAQADLAERAHQLAREDARADREAARLAEIDREVRAHRRDAYLQVITLANTLRTSFVPLDYMHACPLLTESGTDDGDMTAYRAWVDQRIGLDAEILALATAYGSDSMLAAAQRCDTQLAVLLARLQSDMFESIEKHLNSNRRGGGRAFSRDIHTWFLDAVGPVRDSAEGLKDLARRELHLTRG